MSLRLLWVLTTHRPSSDGMGKSQTEEKKAVECGSSTSEASKLESWHLWRFNPALIEEGKNPLVSIKYR